ncbi:Hypothetical predicted protein [Mytilus galloprovincialis]|uniref:Uncharacterized protein n=1 Tax=Mytilus galloprovincialis TaxID=29158 RepID=A0A8B6GCX2_MYTGA|nr:Hypothetical predicted protein [Mytilus galloprovincialis]
MLSLPLVVISLIACSTAQNGLDNGVSRTRVVPLPYYVPYQLPVAQAGPIRRNPVIISDGGGLRGGSGGGSFGGGGFRGGFGGIFGTLIWIAILSAILRSLQQQRTQAAATAAATAATTTMDMNGVASAAVLGMTMMGMMMMA